MQSLRVREVARADTLSCAIRGRSHGADDEALDTGGGFVKSSPVTFCHDSTVGVEEARAGGLAASGAKVKHVLQGLFAATAGARKRRGRFPPHDPDGHSALFGPFPSRLS